MKERTSYTGTGYIGIVLTHPQKSRLPAGVLAAVQGAE